MKRVRVTIVAVEKQIFCACVCGLRYPACTAHVPNCHLLPVPLYNIFPHYLTNGTILGQKLLNIKCVFWFSVQLLSETFLILRRIQWDIINLYWSSRKVPVTVVRFDWYMNENSSSWSPVFPWRQTDGNDEANSHFFSRNSANAHCRTSLIRLA